MSDFDRDSTRDHLTGSPWLRRYQDGSAELLEADHQLRLLMRPGNAPSGTNWCFSEWPYFDSPSRLTWHPLQTGWDMTGVPVPESPSYSVVPPEERRVAALVRSVEVFADDGATGQLWFLGAGHLIGSGRSPTEPRRRFIFNYYMRPRLGRDAWTRFGGYDGWRLDIGRERFFVKSPAAAMDLIAARWGSRGTRLWLTRYEEDTLCAHADDQGRATVSYQPDRSAAERFSGTFDDSAPLAFFHWVEDGDEYGTPETTVITRFAALAMIHAHLSTGWPEGIGGTAPAPDSSAPPLTTGEQKSTLATGPGGGPDGLF